MTYTPIDSDMLLQIEQYVTAIHRQLRIPGLAIAIVQNQKIIYQRGLGDATPGRSVTPQTPFILGSLSKSFTALAIMQLIEADKLALDTPVQQYLPWFTLRDRVASAHITLLHLLTHTSGLPRAAGREHLLGTGFHTAQHAVYELQYIRLVHPVGSVFEYSNLNYLILGVIIEAVSQEPYERYIQRHIYQPLHMQHSYTSSVAAASDREMASGYQWWFGIPRVAPAPYVSTAIASAFLISCAEDMGRYLLAYLDAGASNGSLLSPQSFAQMFKQQVPIPGRDASYGLGWRIERIGEELLYRHGGEVSNFRADMVMLPAHKLGVVVLANCNNGMVAQLGLDQIALNVVRLLLGQPLPRKMLTFRGFYALVDILVVVISLLQVGSLVQLLRSLLLHRRPTRVSAGSLLALFGDVIGSVVLLWRLPKWADMSWRGLFRYVPDISQWLVGMSAVSLVKVGVRLYRWLRE